MDDLAGKSISLTAKSRFSQHHLVIRTMLPGKSKAVAGGCHKRQKPQAPTPQALIRNRQTRKVANAKGLNRNTNLSKPNLT